MAKPDRERRRFLAALIAGLGGLLLLRRFFSPPLVRQAVRARVAAQEVPADGALVLRRARVAVVRDGAALYALDLTCTHLGCTVTVTPEGMTCPCHGSRFDRHGAVLNGPADRPLRRLTLEERDGEIVVRG